MTPIPKSLLRILPEKKQIFDYFMRREATLVKALRGIAIAHWGCRLCGKTWNKRENHKSDCALKDTKIYEQ